MTRWSVGLVLAAGLLAGSAPASLSASNPDPSTLPAADERPPALVLPSLDGKEVSLESLRGRLVLLHFWATWCPTCRAEMLLLEQAALDHPGNLVVLGINLGEKRARVAAYATSTGITFPILLDTRGRVAARYGVLSLPITLVVGPDGRLEERVSMGSLDPASLTALLDRHLPRGTPP